MNYNSADNWSYLYKKLNDIVESRLFFDTTYKFDLNRTNLATTIMDIFNYVK